MPGWANQQAQQPLGNVPPQMALPPLHPIDEQFAQAEYERTMQTMGGGGGTSFLKFKCAQTGKTNWNGLSAGTKGFLYVRFCSPWAQGKNIFKLVTTHFYRSNSKPQGASINCPGVEQCLICQARSHSETLGDAALAERAKNWGRVRKQYMYNVLDMENLQSHFDRESGKWQPFLLPAGARLHSAIHHVIQHVGGIYNLVDPQVGCKVKLSREKTGEDNMSIEYDARNYQPEPLDPNFYAMLHNLHNLDDFQKPPSYEDMMTVVQDLNLFLPPSAQVQVPQSYGQQNYQPGNQQAFQAQQAQVPAPPAIPLPNAPIGQANVSQPPPQMSPPQMPQAQPVQQTGYTPQAGQGQPSQGQLPPAPQVSMPPQQQPQQPQAAQQPPCFGKFNADDRMCQGCPEPTKSQCMNAVGAVPVQTNTPPDLAALQAQMNQAG